MRNRGLNLYVCVSVLLGLLIPLGERAEAAPRAAARVEKVRALLMHFDHSGRQIVYRQAHTDTTVRVAEAALPKFAELKSGQTVEIELERQDDGSSIALDVRKPRNRGSYVLFVISALVVLFIPAG